MSERRSYKPLSKILEEFEQEEWGTNDWSEIKERIWERETESRQRRMTGMPEEQADWEADE